MREIILQTGGFLTFQHDGGAGWKTDARAHRTPARCQGAQGKPILPPQSPAPKSFGRGWRGYARIFCVHPRKSAAICGWGFGFPIGIGTVNALHTPLNTRKAALFGSSKSKDFTRLQYSRAWPPCFDKPSTRRFHVEPANSGRVDSVPARRAFEENETRHAHWAHGAEFLEPGD
jgi:hypothetical protein